MTDKELLFIDSFQMSKRQVKKGQSIYDGILFKRLPFFDRFHIENKNHQEHLRYYDLTEGRTARILIFFESNKALIMNSRKFSVSDYCKDNELSMSDIEEGSIGYDKAREILSIHWTDFKQRVKELTT